MNLRTALYLSLAATLGCSARPSSPSGFWHFVGRNLVQEPIRWADDGSFKHKASKHAHEAWAAVADSVAEECRGHDYKHGFIEGFVDYLDAGGNGEPPAMPPFRHRLSHHMTADGVASSNRWFAGFRHGAAEAKASGLRDAIITPISAAPGPPPTTAAVPPEPPPAIEPKNATLPLPREARPPKALPPPKPLDDKPAAVGPTIVTTPSR